MPPQPPIAKVQPTLTAHLRWTLTDPYAWLQDKTDPEVIAYLEAENAYARQMMQPTEPLQEQIYQEMRGRIAEDDSSAPQLRGEYWYYTRYEAGKQYRLFCRKHGSLDAPEEILLDENALAQGHSYCRVLACEPSPDHARLAYSVDTTGSIVFDLYVKEIASGALLAGPIPQVATSLAWANDSRSLFYTVFDASHRPYQLFRLTLPELSPTLIYHEPDDHFMLLVRRARSGAYLLLTVFCQSATEVRFLPADQPEAPWTVIQPRQPWMEYYAEHHGEHFWIRTNHQARNFRLMQAPVGSPGMEAWREVLPHRPDVLLEGVLAFRDHLVLIERQGGLSCFRLSDPDALSNVRYVPFPEPVYSVFAESPVINLNPQFDTDLLRFEYSSLVTPDCTVDYDLRLATWTVKKQMVIPSGYDPTPYRCERLTATAPDGAQVPISLVYRVGTEPVGARDIVTLPDPVPQPKAPQPAAPIPGAPCPLYLTAYGAYGYSFDAEFDPRRLSLLERGFVVAIAHVRGGSEMGRDWYDHGRLMHKKNTFTDFIASAEHLIAQGYSTASQLVIEGASAGGLLVSAVLNLRPELFKAALARVPWTNVVTAMLMPDLPLTVIEYDQWGDPADEAAFEYMLSYSPYDHIEAKEYPSILARAGLNDLQVPYWDPAKWVARLRAHKTDSNPLLLLTNLGAGHSGASGRYDHLKEDAQNYAFLISAVHA